MKVRKGRKEQFRANTLLIVINSELEGIAKETTVVSFKFEPVIPLALMWETANSL